MFNPLNWQTLVRGDLPELDSNECTLGASFTATKPSLPSIEYEKSFFEPASQSLSRRRHQSWKPLTQKTVFLIGIILATGGIIALLHMLLLQSIRDGGILFAPNINQLPAGLAAGYLYLPTILFLILSFTWTWIDLDVKRLHPFWQLSRTGGARGRDSILLHYLTDFMLTVPLKASKLRHWPIAFTSSAVVTMFWGIIPLQSSMFTTETIERQSTITMATSTKHIPLDQQESLLTGFYAQSVYNIAWLNETLPSFMSRDAMLTPFGAIHPPATVEKAEAWTTSTRLYSVDVTCHDAIETNVSWHAQNGCSLPKSATQPPSNLQFDQYMSIFVQYSHEGSDSSSFGSCPVSASQTFFLQWARGHQDSISGASSSIEPMAATTLYCETAYYQQDVNATVTPPHMSVSNIVPLGAKMAFPADLMNITNFEASIGINSGDFVERGQYPISKWPDATQRLQYLNLIKPESGLPLVTGFAISAYQRSAADYMNASLLAESYQAAYRLLFARRLVDVLSRDIDESTQRTAIRAYQTRALVLIPSFVYMVESLLGWSVLVACTLLYFSHTLDNKLQSDPANIASLMALAAEDTVLCQELGHYDHATLKGLDDALAESTFGLLEETKLNSGRGYGLKMFGHPSRARSVSHETITDAKPSPWELSWICGGVLITIQLGIFVAIIYTFLKTNINNGIPLPSTSSLVNQLVESYIPMAIVATFEPVWVMLSRLLCMLQPYKNLLKGKAHARQSITITYDSLATQAVIGQALRAGHIFLAIICSMTILANGLSMVTTNLFYEDIARVITTITFDQTHSFPLSGTSIGNDSFALGVPYYDPFYIAVSNLTAGTPLPRWIDQEFFYLPFENQNLSYNIDTLRQATTHAVGARLNCVPLTEAGPNSYISRFVYGTPQRLFLNATVTFPDAADSCQLSLNTTMRDKPDGDIASEAFLFDDTSIDSSCDNIVIAGWLRSANVSWPHLGPVNASWMACKPEVQIQRRKVVVDRESTVMYSETVHDAVEIGELFKPSTSSFISSVHRILNQGNISVQGHESLGATWHNDSYSSDFLNYLMATARNTSDTLNPTMPIPSFDQMSPAFGAVYAQLFAIILGLNFQNISQATPGNTVDGLAINVETRMMVSKPIFVISMVILCLYLIATIGIYVKRPWKIMPRLPTTIASHVAFFAASQALEDMKGTAPMSIQGRNWYIENLGNKYGFGQFLGSDGKGHYGIEREPLC